jgi:hypothetical protein
MEVEAWSIGPDLQQCTAVLTKKPRSSFAAPGEGGISSPAGGPSVESGWETGGHADGGLDDRPDPDGMPSDDPWADPVPVGSSTGEVAVGV